MRPAHPASSLPAPVAALVLGSDSFRLMVAQLAGSAPTVLDSEHMPLRLAARLDAQGCLGPETMREALDAVRRLRERLDAWPLQAVHAVATSTLRMARDAHVFLPAAQQALGIEVRVLSGEEEARLTCLGVLGGLAPAARALVLSIGGGSTQYALGAGMEVERAGSVALGTVRQALTFFGAGRIDAVSFAGAVASARVKLAERAEAYGPAKRDGAYGASGTIRTLARLAAAKGLGGPDGPLRPAALEALAGRVLEHAAGGRQLAGLGRLHLRDVAAALAILLGIMEELEIGELLLPEAGLRHGLLYQLQPRHSTAVA